MSHPLRIAQIAPLWENVPPPLYGGTERVVHELTEGLVQAGQAVTLFACGTSHTTAQLTSVYPRPLFRDGVSWNNIMYPLLNITEAFDHADDFDILHMHLNTAQDYMALPLAERYAHKTVITLHFPYPQQHGESVDRYQVLQKYKQLNYISISNAQRNGSGATNWVDTVYNGINLTPYTLHEQPEDYVIWVGQFRKDKGVYEAIQAARAADIKLILAGTIDVVDPERHRYYTEIIEPLIDGKSVVYVGEINEQEKNEYFGKALAFLNPIQWNEPFGLVMAESMAAGTPVISFRNGSAPEVIADGVTGYLVDDVDAMAEKIKTVGQLNRAACRQRVEQLFSAERMTAGYLETYRQLAKV